MVVSDYESILRKAVDQAGRPDQAQRDEIYERARQTLFGHLGGAKSDWSREGLDAQFEQLETAIARIESEFSERPPAWRSHLSTEEHHSPAAASARSASAITVSSIPPWGLIATGSIAIALMVGLGLYITVLGGGSTQPSVQQAGPTVSPTRALETSTAAPQEKPSGPSYILRRQYVYYRTTHPVGAIIISRSQRFLYLVQPNHVAVRYTIGVGPECQTLAGLFRISQKVQQPEPSVPESTNTPALLFGTGRSVHRTSEPESVGRQASFGCFHSWDNDIAELYERVRLNERVVVAN